MLDNLLVLQFVTAAISVLLLIGATQVRATEHDRIWHFRAAWLLIVPLTTIILVVFGWHDSMAALSDERSIILLSGLFLTASFWYCIASPLILLWTWCHIRLKPSFFLRPRVINPRCSRKGLKRLQRSSSPVEQDKFVRFDDLFPYNVG